MLVRSRPPTSRVRAVLRRTFFVTSAASLFLHKLSFAKGNVMMDDPMLAPWVGAHGGFPPFDKIKKADFKPAFAKAMDLMRGELDAIAKSTKPATFDNTIVAMEDAGRALGRVSSVFDIFTSTMADKEVQQLEADMAPVLAAFDDEIRQNAALFARIKAVYDARESQKLAPDQLRLVEVTYKSFARRGAALGDADKKRMKEINGRLAALFTAFGQNELHDEETYTLALDDKDLAGLPDSVRTAMKSAAEAKGQKDKWLITNTRSSVEPFLTYSSRRDLREKAFRMWTRRGDMGDAHDNKKPITEILALRGERAKLLGFASHAHWIIDDNMAKTPDAARALMMKVWKAAVARVREEVADMQKLADAEKAKLKIEPWDYRYYAEKVRKAKYDLDEAEVKPYFELNNVLENGVFYAANQLYGITFKERKDIPVYHPDVRVFEVSDADGKALALFYCDYFKRDNKNGGAWMGSFVDQSRLLGTLPVVYNVANLPKPAPGEPALISFTDVTTMFHEFGHALHGMFANTEYPSLSGTATARDFVEFPSQFNEHWALYPTVFTHYAKHYKTGAPMPADLASKIKKAASFNQGYKLTELVAAAELDMQWHTLPASAAVQQPDVFEKQALERTHLVLSAVPPRYRSSYFSHIWFNGYSAGYYAYLWSEMLDDDAYQWFEEHGGLTRANGDRFRQMVLSRGNTEDLAKMYAAWRGKEPSVEPMMKYRGLKESGH